MSFLGGSSDVSSAQSGASINSSGWVVGKGSATGGRLSSSSGGFSIPWYGWASIGLVVVAWARLARKKKG